MAAMHVNPPYSEPLRPQFHFTAKSGWLNDPNGLVYFKGEYHLFFQHNPKEAVWGNMTWGHAVSRDLVHWRQTANAIEPDALGTIFSGSAVVDRENTSGLGAGMVCLYTAAGGTSEESKGQPFTQCLAHSADGRTFTKFSGNPVLGHVEGQNRDPKVIWHAPTKRWVMALYLDGNHYGLFGSANLLSWKRLSTVEMDGTSECPDFFELPVDNDRRQMKWVFWGANGRYRIGGFDGTTFTPETELLPTNFGNTGYAAQTFFNDPKGRRVQIAWHNNSVFPSAAWNQEMGFPTELKLVSTPGGPRLSTLPIPEVRSLYGPRATAHDGFYAVESGLMDVSMAVRVGGAGSLNVQVNGHPIRYDGATHELKALDKVAKVEPSGGLVKLRMLVDRASIEIFAQDGLVTMPLFVLPVDAPKGLRLAMPSDWKVEKIEVHALRSAWSSD